MDPTAWIQIIVAAKKLTPNF